MPDVLDELEKLARAATPGPRKLVMDEPYELEIEASNHRRLVKVWLDDAPVEDYNAQQRSDAAYIAALSPERVIAMIACLKAATVMREESVPADDFLRALETFDAALSQLQHEERG